MKGTKAMNTKHFVVATAIMMLVAMSGQAYAGITISDKRYWPSGVSSVHRNVVQRPENAFASTKTPAGFAAIDRPYEGGPKGDD
jgi:hypothetical protein